MHSEYHPNALLWLQGSAHFYSTMNPTTLYSKSMRRFFHSSNKPSSLLPQGLCICWSFTRNIPYTCLARSSLSCRAPHTCQVHSSKTDETPRSVILSCITMFFSFIALTTASSRNPLMSLCLTSFSPCPDSSLSYPPPYPQHLAQGLMHSKCVISV